MSELTTEAAVDRLVAALAAIDDLDPDDVRDSVLSTDPLERAGAMAGVLITRVVDVLIAAAGNPHADGDGERGASVIAHMAAAGAINQVTGEHTVGFVTTCANLLWSAVQYPTFRHRHPGLDTALGDHLGSVVDHGLTYLHNHSDTDNHHAETDHAGEDEDGDTITVAVNPTEHPSIDRLTEACTALGITPVIAVANAPVNHHAVPVTALAGIITGRVALEYANAIEDAPNALAGALTPIWANGVRAGITTDPRDTAGDDLVAGVMMRVVMNLGKWFSREATGRRSDAVAMFLDAAVSAARTDALETADADSVAEYIAHTGADAADEHASALDKAAEAIDILKRC